MRLILLRYRAHYAALRYLGLVPWLAGVRAAWSALPLAGRCAVLFVGIVVPGTVVGAVIVLAVEMMKGQL